MKRLQKHNLILLIIAAVVTVFLGGCGTKAENAGESSEAPAAAAEAERQQDLSDAPALPGLACISKMEPEYAVSFEVYDYENGYTLIDVAEEGQYLLIPENEAVPEGLAKEIIPIRKPVQNIYLTANAAFSLFDAMDALDAIRFSGAEEGDIGRDSVTERMKEGKILHAGKYDSPDYEALVKENCGLAVMSTRIHHNPEIIELLTDIGIPVFIDRSSYENHPLGRTEWIRLYGVLTDRRKEADAYFETQKQVIEQIAQYPSAGKTAAVFYFDSDGTVIIRRPEDYFVKMIELAGGEYIFKDYESEKGLMSISISAEEFYAAAKDADILIYNAAASRSVNGIGDLMAISPLLADFKAVKEGQIWTTDRAVFQAADITGEITLDLRNLFTDQDASGMRFFSRID